MPIKNDTMLLVTMYYGYGPRYASATEAVDGTLSFVGSTIACAVSDVFSSGVASRLSTAVSSGTSGAAWLVGRGMLVSGSVGMS